MSLIRRFGFVLLAMVLIAAAHAEQVTAEAGRPPRISPDYAGVTIPTNIAPMNFRIEEVGKRYRVELSSRQGSSVVITSRKKEVDIPAADWRSLLSRNPGEPLLIAVSVLGTNNQWLGFQTITNQIAPDPLDGHLVYRLLKPLYNVYVNIGIYQRDLQKFEERPVLENKAFGGDCLNCHTFLNHSGSTFAINIRTATNVHPMLLTRSNEVARVDKTMGYLAWHPSGKLIAFTANKLSMLAHTTGESRDVYDAVSNLGVFFIDSNRVVSPPAIAHPDFNENWPNWSPDGRFLYYSRAVPQPVERFKEIRYDLMRIPFDLERFTWGEPEVLVSAAQTGLSANQPKVSPDGRYILFCLSAWGHFPVYQPSSDLYLYDLAKRSYRRLSINSLEADSWHCWSTSGRWVVFSSKRLDGLFARPFFSYVDGNGEFHKPFVLPQKDPGFYELYLKTFNVPELISDPVVVSQQELARAVLNPRRVLVPASEQKLPASDPGARDAEASMHLQGPK